MKIGIALILFCFIFSPPPKLAHIDLAYKGVMRSNARFGQTEEQYSNQQFIFATDTVLNCGLIKFVGHKENTTLPLKIPIAKKRKKGEAWTETYQNDSILLMLKGIPGNQKMQSAFWYDVDMELIMKGDTLREKWVGYCGF